MVGDGSDGHGVVCSDEARLTRIASAPFVLSPGIFEAEAGLPGFILDGWFALFAPAGTPQPVIDKLNAALRKIARMDVTRERASQLGTVLKDWTPAEMDAFAKSEVAAWGKVIRDNNITMD